MTGPLHLAAFLVAAVLATGGCSALTSSPREDQPAGDAAAGDAGASAGDALGSHTPDPLVHPCDIVTSKVATHLLGVLVKAAHLEDPMTGRTQDCGYTPAKQGSGTPSLEILSTPDPTPLDKLVGLYLGVDRLPHHPADVVGADDAEVVTDPDATAPTVTVFVKQGYVTHTVVVGLDDVGRAERLGLEAAELLVAGNA